MIFLVGMPMVGKTYWAQHLATHYQLSYADLDVVVEEAAEMSIPEMFAARGEAAFRKAERTALKTIIEKNEIAILACGGGTPIFEDNMQLMKNAGCIVYLQADVDILLSRMDEASRVRPLLSGQEDKRALLTELLAKRKNIYEQAHYILDADRVSVSNFAQIISTCTNRH